jgi:tripartite-type tricarboxylate transporter receptor subunit TctC
MRASWAANSVSVQRNSQNRREKRGELYCKSNDPLRTIRDVHSMKAKLVMALSLAALFCAAPAAAQDYPNKPISVIVPHPAGGTSDILARTTGAELAKDLKQQVIVENKAGANGVVAAQTVAKAKPDGYTLLLATASTHAINPSLYRKFRMTRLRTTPIVLIATVPNVLVVAPHVKANNVSELIEYIRAKSGKANMGSAGSGTPGHLAGQMFKARRA